MFAIGGDPGVYLQNDIDRYFPNVGLLVNGEDPNGTTTFTDRGPKAYAQTTATNIRNTSTNFKMGLGSIYATGTNASVTFASTTTWANLSTRTFTFESWVYITTWVTTNKNVDLSTGGGGALPNVNINNDFGGSNVWFGITTGAATIQANIGVANSATVLSTGVWHHLCIQKNSTSSASSTATTDFYWDGVKFPTTTGGAWSSSASAQTMTVGRSDGAAHASKYIDDYRWTMDVVRYPGSPDTIPVPDRPLPTMPG